MGRSFQFEDGIAYEFATSIGRLTIVCDVDSFPPLRVYGPDGVQVDPRVLTRIDEGDWHAGYLAFDLTCFSERR